MIDIIFKLKRVKFLINFLYFISLYFFLYCFGFFFLKRENLIFIPQNWQIGGTKKFTWNFLNYITKKRLNVIILLPKGEEQDFKNKFDPSFYKKIICIDKKIFQHKTHWYSKKHSLFKYFLFDFIEQSLFFLRISVRERAGCVFASIARPTELFNVFMLPGKIFYFLHTVPWIEIDNGSEFILKKRICFKRKIITVSEYALERINHFWKLEEFKHFTCYIPNFTEVSRLNQIRKDNEEIVITCISTVIEDKNPFLFIRIAKEIINRKANRLIKFIWVGGGKSRSDDALLRECRKATAAYSNIEFVGHQDQVETILGISDIYLHTSKRESHGIAVIEAMSFGLPCIVIDSGGVRESVFNGENGFIIREYEFEKSIESILKLVNSKELRLRMGQKSLKIYKAKFTANVWKQRMDSLLSEHV